MCQPHLTTTEKYELQITYCYRCTALIIIIIFLHGLRRLTCSGIDAMQSLPRASTISSSSSRFVVEGVFALINPYPTAFPYGNGMVLHFYQQQESSTTKIVHKVINKGLKTYV